MAAAVVATVLAGGCSSAGSSEFPRSGAQSYSDPQEIADDLSAAGIACAMTRDPDGASKFHAMSGRCKVDDQEVVLLTFAAKSYQAEYTDFAVRGPTSTLGVGGCLLSGVKWAVNCGTQGTGEKIQSKALGGKLTVTGGAK